LQPTEGAAAAAAAAAAACRRRRRRRRVVAPETRVHISPTAADVTTMAAAPSLMAVHGGFQRWSRCPSGRPAA